MENARKERLVRALGGDHTVGDGGVGDLGAIVLEVGVWFAVDICDPGHVGGCVGCELSKQVVSKQNGASDN